MIKRLFFAFLFLGVAFFTWFFVATRPVTSKDISPVEFEIQTGWGVDRISQELSTAKLIRSRSAFKITVITLGINKRIQAGFFRLSPNMGVTEIAEALTHATIKQVRVTIPEGLRRQEIAFILDKAFQNVEGKMFSSSEFLKLTADKEGMLFPDTYDFDPKSGTSTVIDRLSNRFHDVVNDLKISSKDTEQITILASLLERESANSNEMPEIAGVIKNRLKGGWPLQIDATVQYAVASSRCRKIDCDWWPQATKADLQLVSPYNTYLNQGLPPKPISNPGRAALAAAASPKTTSAWFYIHDQQGKVHFSDTLEEHNQYVCTFLKENCQN